MRLNLTLGGFLLILLLNPTIIWGQTKAVPVGEVTVEAKNEFGKNQSYFFDVPIYRTLRDSLLQKAEGFFVEQSHSACNLDLKIRAVEDKPHSALLTFYIVTKNSTKSSSFRRTIKVKKGETKSLDIYPKLSCLNTEKYSFVVTY